jgi:hypothetical protein
VERKELWVDIEDANADECVWTVDWRERRRAVERDWKEERFKREEGGGFRRERARGIGLN